MLGLHSSGLGIWSTGAVSRFVRIHYFAPRMKWLLPLH
jgi:hypothetical protein